MSRKKLNQVEQIQRVLQDAAIMSCDLPFDREESGKIIDELFMITSRIGEMEARRRQKLLEIQSPKSVKSFDQPPVVEVLSVTDHTVVIRCPYCGERHIHGKTPGHVTAHCVGKYEGSCSYIIPKV